MIHPELRDALLEAFDIAYRESLQDGGAPQFWTIDYGNGCGWFLYVTSNRRLWADA